MIERILKLIKERGITAKKLTDELELSNSAITDWKKGKARPSTDAIIKIANYFNVSADYILTGKDFSNDSASNCNTNIFNENEEILLSGFRKLNNTNKGILLGKLELLLELNSDSSDVEFTVNNSKQEYLQQSEYSKINVKHIPLLGESIDEPPTNIIRIAGKDYVEVPKYLDVDYAFFSKDESMSPNINCSDLIFIKATPIVESGTIAMTELDRVLTCRKVDSYHDRIEFVPINRQFKTNKYFKSSLEMYEIRTASIRPQSKTHKVITSYKIIGKASFAQDKELNFFAI
nr:helix-turn-helix domain-containing protein [Sedimentibacter sp.]